MNPITKWLTNRKARTNTTPQLISQVTLCCVCGQVFVNVKEVPEDHLCIRHISPPSFAWTSTAFADSTSTTDWHDITITPEEEDEDALPE